MIEKRVLIAGEDGGAFWRYPDGSSRCITAADVDLINEALEPPKSCMANFYSDPPQDCNWPFCGCDPKTNQIMSQLQECGIATTEPIAWESRTPVYKKYITETKFRKLRPAYQKWYKPYKCSSCRKGP